MLWSMPAHDPRRMSEVLGHYRDDDYTRRDYVRALGRLCYEAPDVVWVVVVLAVGVVVSCV